MENTEQQQRDDEHEQYSAMLDNDPVYQEFLNDMEAESNKLDEQLEDYDNAH